MTTPALVPNPAIATSPVKPLTDAIMGQLQAANWTGSDLQPLLATIPGTSPLRFAIHNGIVNTEAASDESDAQPLYNCITFRVALVSPNPAFEGPFAEAPTNPVDNCRVDIEVWCGDDRCDVSEIMAIISSLFRNKRFPLAGGAAAGENATMFRAKSLPATPDLYDKVLHCHFGVMSFLFCVQR